MTMQNVGYKAKALEPRNLLLYFLIAFGLPVLVFGPFMLGILDYPSRPGPGLIFAFVVVQFAPLIAAVVVTAATQGRTGLRALWDRFWNRDLSLKWLLIILLFNPMVRLLGNLISRAAGGEAYPFLEAQSLLSLLVTGFIVGVQEEFGWRGFVLPRFQAKWSALVSSLILGAIWAPYHLGNWILGARQDSFWEFSLWIILMAIFTT